MSMFKRLEQVLSVFVILVFLVCSRVGAEGQSLADHPDVASRLRLLEAYIEAHIAYDGWPGLSIGIVHDQTLIYERGFGHADLEEKTRADEHTLYPIGSNTKMFTAISVLKLRDEGKLQLDDPVSKHLTWFDRIQNDYVDAEPITVRQLLTHSSGMPREALASEASDAEGLYDPSLERIIADISEQAVVWEPGTRWKYSNLGVSLLGAMVAEITGMPYEKCVGTHILEPLGMKNSCFYGDFGTAGVLATGYGQRMPNGKRQKMAAHDMKGYMPAGGLWSSVHDLALFASWQFRLREAGGFEILRASTLRDMQRAHWLDSSWMLAWGLGFLIYHKQPHDLIGHGGHIAGYRTDFTISPHDKIAVIILTNGDDIKVYPDQPKSISNRVFEWVVPTIRNAIEGSPGVVVDEFLERYTGKYQIFNQWNVEILILDGKLVMFDPFDPPDRDNMEELVAIEDNVFRLVTADGFSSPGELVVFEENDRGEIIGFRCEGVTRTRVEGW